MTDGVTGAHGSRTVNYRELMKQVEQVVGHLAQSTGILAVPPPAATRIGLSIKPISDSTMLGTGLLVLELLLSHTIRFHPIET